jgi:hypothetical protein
MPRSSDASPSRSSGVSSETEFDERNEIISLVRHGTMTPEQAEAHALAKGWEPFATRPEMPAFDPMRESRWTIAMAIAWIAWRDDELVRQNSLKFSSECWDWVWRKWNQPTNAGTEFTLRAGWFLEQWNEPTAIRLLIQEVGLKRRNSLPETARLSVAKAEEVLWEALGVECLVAEALDANGRPTAVPAREWSYLKLFEERKRDVIKYDALDRTPPYTEVKFKRVDVLRLWPAVSQYRELKPLGFVESGQIASLGRGRREGYVPLCTALLWIMTDCGARQIRIDDVDAWSAAVASLMPFLQSEEVQLTGLPRNGGLAATVPGHALALVKILPLLQTVPADCLLDAPSHIDCSPFYDSESWMRDLNDKLYLTGRIGAEWTHLQVKKAQILEHWLRPTPKANAGVKCFDWLVQKMQKSPTVKRTPKGRLREEAQDKFSVAQRQFDRIWDNAIEKTGATAWSNAGRTSTKIKSPHHVKS